jgi:hypothetical protein
MRIAGRGNPRWFSLCGCGPEFVANRSLGGIVTAARTWSHSNSQKCRECVPLQVARASQAAGFSPSMDEPPQASQAAEKMSCFVILSEAKNWTCPQF